MKYFKIYALGDDFDIDAYLALHPMVPSKVWRRGDPKGRSPDSCPFESSGIEFALGAPGLPLAEQQRIAIEFLTAHRESLLDLSTFRGVSYFTLGLECHRVTLSGSIHICLDTSAWLLWHLVDVGCRLTQYVSASRREAHE